MEENKKIYLAKACKIVKSGTYDFKYKRCELYDEKIIVIESENNIYKEIITGIQFERYPESFNDVNDHDVYIFLKTRIDNLKEGYHIIEKYYNETNENSILHMFDWFNMDETDRLFDSKKRKAFKVDNYTKITNDLVKRRMN